MMKSPKPFVGALLPIYNLYSALYSSDASEHSGVGKHEVVISSFHFCIDNLGSTCWSAGVLVCIHGSATILEKFSWWPMNFSGSLWWTVKRPDFIVFDGGLCSRYGWLFFSYYSNILCSATSSKYPYSLSYYMMCYSCE